MRTLRISKFIITWQPVFELENLEILIGLGTVCSVPTKQKEVSLEKNLLINNLVYKPRIEFEGDKTKKITIIQLSALSYTSKNISVKCTVCVNRLNLFDCSLYFAQLSA